MSYAGHFDLTVVVDSDACPDGDVFVAGLRDSLHQMSAGDDERVDGLVGSPEVSVYGVREGGAEEPIISRGEWGFSI